MRRICTPFTFPSPSMVCTVCISQIILSPDLYIGWPISRRSFGNKLWRDDAQLKLQSSWSGKIEFLRLYNKQAVRTAAFFAHPRAYQFAMLCKFAVSMYAQIHRIRSHTLVKVQVHCRRKDGGNARLILPTLYRWLLNRPPSCASITYKHTSYRCIGLLVHLIAVLLATETESLADISFFLASSAFIVPWEMRDRRDFSCARVFFISASGRSG